MSRYLQCEVCRLVSTAISKISCRLNNPDSTPRSSPPPPGVPRHAAKQIDGPEYRGLDLTVDSRAHSSSTSSGGVTS